MIINNELLLKDLETVDKRVSKLKSQSKSGDKNTKAALEVAERLLSHIEDGNLVTAFECTPEERATFRDVFLLTDKKMLYACNVDESDLPNGENNPEINLVREIAAKQNAEVVIFCAQIEAEVAELDEEERQMFLSELGITDTGLNRLIRGAYRELGLITYFTAGEKEVRAWTIKDGYKAPQAAGVIHTDFERGFIRAETIKYDDYIACGSEAAAKEAGKMRSEGKEYLVQDGDVMLFRFNV